MPDKLHSCLSYQQLEQIGQNNVSSDELRLIEDHVSECEHCRELFDTQHSSSQWSDFIRPALSETQMPDSFVVERVDAHSSALLNLLGPTDDPEMLGRIGNYEIVGIIGQGGMGAVFKGFDRSLNRFVAIKMLLPHLAASGAARKRFAREGQAVAAVVDDHVMAIHCVDEWKGIPYLVMTYSRGVSLQKRLNDNGPLGVREILRIGMQAAKGLSAAHAQGIVHRDIKPSNILLDQNVERVQLVDFGLARAIDDASLTCSGTLAGTPQYMSPEQARAETVDHRSDLFSLGSVLYAMCVGHAPFRAESSYSVLRLITDKEPRPIREANPEIPEWLCSIVEKLMNKTPENRYASASEVASIFEQCLAHLQDPMRYALPMTAQGLNGSSRPKWLNVGSLLRWFPIMNDKRIVSLISLLLMLLALLVPWPIATVGKVETALAFACTAMLLSLGLALLSRTEYFSRIVLWGIGVPLCLGLVGVVVSVPVWLLRSNSSLVGEHQTMKDRVDDINKARLTSDSRDPSSESQGVQVNFDQETRIAEFSAAAKRADRVSNVFKTYQDTQPPAPSNPPMKKEDTSSKVATLSQSPIAVLMVMHPAELRNGNTIQRSAAKTTLGLLNDNDYCGILSYGMVDGKSGTKGLWGEGSVLQQVAENRKAWIEAISSSMTGDFPDFAPAFQMALDAFNDVKAEQKLMLVFTDGDPIFVDETFLDKFRAAQIQVSVIQVDIHLIQENSLLKRLAESTGGTFHYALASQSAVVENFFVKEVQKLRTDVGNALREIGLGFHKFHSKIGSFPGSRMIQLDRRKQEFEHPFSWRVAILPYIGQQQLFDEYRFDEPWDSPNNSLLLKKMPEIYRSPNANSDQPIGNSNMLGFATERGGLGLKSGEAMSSFTDGTSNTIMIVETSQSVPWTKPIDLTESTVQPMVGQRLRFVLADGSIGEMNLPDGTRLEKMITRNGGEPFEEPVSK